MKTKTLSCKPLGLNALKGNTICLKRSSPKYIDFIQACHKNTVFMDLYRINQPRDLSKEALEESLEALASQMPHEMRFIEWIIFKIKDNEEIPIGLISLADYQPKHRRAELLLGIINQEDRKGFSSLEAALLLFDFAFNQLNLHKLLSYVYGYNTYAQKNTLQLGFKQEGLFLDHIHTDDGFIDLYQNGLLRTDFLKNKRLSRFSSRLLKRDITQARQTNITPLSDELMKKFLEQVRK